MTGADYSALADKRTILETLEALGRNNIDAVVVENAAEALEKVRTYLPDGVEVMTGSSKTLDQIGFTDILKSGNHPWVNLKEGLLKEKDPKAQAALRRKITISDYFLGSVQAITIDGQVLVVSASGSQIPSYAFSSPHVIWVAGTQKIVSTYKGGIRRIEEYCFPIEDQRMKKAGFQGSSISEILIVRKSFPGRIRLILVKQVLGV